MMKTIEYSMVSVEDYKCNKCRDYVLDIYSKLCHEMFGSDTSSYCFKERGSKQYFSREYRGCYGDFCDSIDNLIDEILVSIITKMVMHEIDYEKVEKRRLEIYGFRSPAAYWDKQEYINNLDQIVYLIDRSLHDIYTAINLCDSAYRYGFLSKRNVKEMYVCYGNRFSIHAVVTKLFFKHVLEYTTPSVMVDCDPYEFFYSRDVQTSKCDIRSIPIVVGKLYKYDEKLRNYANNPLSFALSIDADRDSEVDGFKSISHSSHQYVAYCNFPTYIRGRYDDLHNQAIIFNVGVSKLSALSAIPLCTCSVDVKSHDIIEYIEMIEEEKTESQMIEILEKHEKCDTCKISPSTDFSKDDVPPLPKIGYRPLFASKNKMVLAIRMYAISGYKGDRDSYGWWIYREYFNRFLAKYGKKENINNYVSLLLGDDNHKQRPERKRIKNKEHKKNKRKRKREN